MPGAISQRKKNCLNMTLRSCSKIPKASSVIYLWVPGIPIYLSYKVDLYDSGIVYTGMSPKGIISYSRDTCLAMSIVCVFTIARKWEKN